MITSASPMTVRRQWSLLRAKCPSNTFFERSYTNGSIVATNPSVVIVTRSAAPWLASSSCTVSSSAAKCAGTYISNPHQLRTATVSPPPYPCQIQSAQPSPVHSVNDFVLPLRARLRVEPPVMLGDVVRVEGRTRDNRIGHGDAGCVHTRGAVLLVEQGHQRPYAGLT